MPSPSFGSGRLPLSLVPIYEPITLFSWPPTMYIAGPAQLWISIRPPPLVLTSPTVVLLVNQPDAGVKTFNLQAFDSYITGIPNEQPRRITADIAAVECYPRSTVGQLPLQLGLASITVSLSMMGGRSVSGEILVPFMLK